MTGSALDPSLHEQSSADWCGGGIRAAPFETRDSPSPIRGILSMRDLMAEPSEAAMDEHIAGRRELVLRVVRTW